MSDEIINRVANSNLITLDLEDYYPAGERVLFDIKDWLYEGVVLREKDFRAYVNAFDWSNFQDKYVAIICSTDAIIPTWAYMLVSISIESYACYNIIGDLEELETALYHDIITKLDVSQYTDKPIIIKGCSKKPVPLKAYSMIINKLKPVVKSIMFGEACSNVPLFKRK